ncbi:hypothetical protein [Nocardia sp. NPDC049149]|uniref:hypothetical protein n=1 Tax=Nocardia sp. NPDC049149 TaxID=3364315 RepID=UPI00371626D3
MKTGIAHLIVVAAVAAMTLSASSTSSADVVQSRYMRNVYTGLCLTDRGIENYPNAQECAFDGAGNLPPNQQWNIIAATSGPWNAVLLRSGLGNCLRHGTGAEHFPESTVCTNTGPAPSPDYRQIWVWQIDTGAQGVTIRYQTRPDQRTLCLGVDQDAPHLLMMAEQSRWYDHRYIEWNIG